MLSIKINFIAREISMSYKTLIREHIESDAGANCFLMLPPTTQVILVIKYVELEREKFCEETILHNVTVSCFNKKMPFQYDKFSHIMRCDPQKTLKIRITLPIINTFLKDYCYVTKNYTFLETAIVSLISMFNKNINFLFMFVPSLPKNILPLNYDLEQFTLSKCRDIQCVDMSVKNLYEREVINLLIYKTNISYIPFDGTCQGNFSTLFKQIIKENKDCIYVNQNYDGVLFLSAIPL